MSLENFNHIVREEIKKNLKNVYEIRDNLKHELSLNYSEELEVRITKINEIIEHSEKVLLLNKSDSENFVKNNYPEYIVDSKISKNKFMAKINEYRNKWKIFDFVKKKWYLFNKN